MTGNARGSAGRVLLAKVGLDGHDRGIKVVARGLRESGFHVIYGGIWQSPEAVAQAALDEDADWLGISLLNGAHMTLVPRVIEAVKAIGNQRTKFMVGGIIPEDDIPKLNEMGVESVFGPGSSIQKIADFLRQPTEQPTKKEIAALVESTRNGERPARSRLLSRIAIGDVGADDLPRAPLKARTVAITGNAGVGKSSSVAKLIPRLLEKCKKVAVLACDPQSPITGGALLGDRIRMSESVENEPRLLIRSLAVPSGQQGMAEHLDMMIRALEIAGFDMIVVESVGIGQGDVAAGELADQVIVLLQPESGDDIQWEKAGLLEIADAIVIQKSDLPGANRLEAELKENFNLPGFRAVPIAKVSAAKDEGFDELSRLILSES